MFIELGNYLVYRNGLTAIQNNQQIFTNGEP